MSKFKPGDKVVCVDGASWEGSVKEDQQYEIENGPNQYNCYKLVGVKNWWNVDRFELIKEKTMFDIKKDAWFIRVNNEQEWSAANDWLEENYGKRIGRSYLYPTSLTNTEVDGDVYYRLMWTEDRKPHESAKEIKLSYKLVVESAILPETKSQAQKDLEILQEQIAELQKQAEKLKSNIV